MDVKRTWVKRITALKKKNKKTKNKTKQKKPRAFILGAINLVIRHYKKLTYLFYYLIL